MLNLVYDFVPVLLFFIAFKWYGIYTAVMVGMAITALQVLFSFIIFKKLDKKQLITLIVFVVFGGMTLYFHNPLFIKWKPTVIFWIFSLILVLSHFFGKKTIIQRMLEKMLEEKGKLPLFIWKKLNLAWAVFFVLLGGANLFVAYHFSTNTWVNFKLYGVMSALLIFSVIQSIYLTYYLVDNQKEGNHI